jgi:WD40 repeat protein
VERSNGRSHDDDGGTQRIGEHARAGPVRVTHRDGPGGGDGTVQIWDATTGEPLLALRGHLGSATHVSFDAEGSRLATTGYDGFVRIWELDRAELVRIAEARLTRGLTDDECREFLHTARCDPG